LSSPDRVRIRVKSGQNEAEIEAERANLREAIELIPEIVSRFPAQRLDLGREAAPEPAPNAPVQAQPSQPTGPVQMPAINVEKGDSLSDIISKCFGDQWGKSPRKLSEVRDVLQSYGLNYPKQSVAVALLRLAKASRIRRFKSGGGEYVYTVSTSMMSSPSQLLVPPDAAGTATEAAIENPANV